MKIKQTAPLLALAFIWGCYYVASQRAVSGMSVFSAGVVIRLITLLLLTVIMWKRGELPLLLKTKGVKRRLLLIGGLGFLLDLTGFIGLSLSSVGSGAALLKCDILFVNLISVIIYKEKFSKKEWLSTFVMLFGVLLVMGIDFRHFRLGGGGDIFFVLSALFISINAFVIKSVQLDQKYPTSDHVIAYYNNGITMLLFIVTSLVLGTFSQLFELGNAPGTMTALGFAGIGQTLIYVVYYYNLRRNPVWIVKIFLLLMPIVSALLGFLLFGETMVFNQYVGAAIVLSGALGILLEQGKKQRSG